jgi:putative spermidine/putrescine transport system permease protein
VLRRTLLILLVLYLLLPVVASFIYSLSGSWTQLLPENMGVRAWVKLGEDARFWQALGRTAILSFSVVALSVVFLVPTLFVVKLYMPKVGGWLEFLTLWPFVFPGVILALGLIQLYSQPPIRLAQTPYLLIAAATVIALPYAYRAVENAFAAADVKTLAEAARSLGADDAKTLLWVILPTVLPGVLSGGVLAFSASFGEFALAQLLVGTVWETLPVYQVQIARTDGSMSAAITTLSFIAAWGLGALALSLRRDAKVSVI